MPIACSIENPVEIICAKLAPIFVKDSELPVRCTAIGEGPADANFIATRLRPRHVRLLAVQPLNREDVVVFERDFARVGGKHEAALFLRVPQAERVAELVNGRRQQRVAVLAGQRPVLVIVKVRVSPVVRVERMGQSAT